MQRFPRAFAGFWVRAVDPPITKNEKPFLKVSPLKKPQKKQGS
jgi:hypothetical protein